MAFNFGATTTTKPSLFGTATTTQSTGFGGFGTQPAGAGTGFGGLGAFGTTTTTSTGTGFSGFGFGGTTATTTSAPAFGGFGTGTALGGATTTSTFSFSTATTTSSGFNFFGGGGLGTTTTPATGGLGGFGTTGFGTAGTTGAFGTAGTTGGFGTTGTAGGFGTTGGFGTAGGFGTTGATGGFGTTGTAGGGIFGAPAGSNLQAQAGANDPNLNYMALVARATRLVQIFGDERDAIITKWNQLQAYWGTGKGYYQGNGCVDFKPENHFCRFKALGYHLIPTGSNEQGQVALVLARKESEVATVQQQIVDTLHKILGSRPTYSVCVEGIKPLPEDKTEVVIYVLERPATGPAKRVPANEVFAFLNQATQRQQLTSQLNMESLMPRVGWTKEQVKEYLEKPPPDVDPLLWQQAKLDNPDPSKYIPVPMVGFKELQRRLKYQAEQTKLYQQRLDVMASELTDLQTQHSTMLSKLEDYKRKDLELGHRLLKVLVKQEIYRKMGYGIQVEEETLKVQLEQLQAELNHPTQFKGRLNELMSQMRMQLQSGYTRPDQTYGMDNETQTEIRQMLKQQQEGLQHLINIIKEDADDLQLIEQGMAKPTAR